MNEFNSKFKTSMLKRFFAFLVARQSIYWKRKRLEPRPWTKDPILQNYFFCNVYRELDRGTQFCMNNVLNSTKKYSDVVFRVMLYRMFNEPRTYQFLESHLSNFKGIKAADVLDRKHEAGIRIFRGAWMTSGANVVGSKARAYCLELEKVYRDRVDLWDEIREMSKMEDVWKRICEIRWFGGFSSYQVVLDLSYIVSIRNNWSDYDTWVYPGPGAKLGLMWLLGHAPIRRKGAGVSEELGEEADDMIRHLYKKQKSYFNMFDLTFPRWDNKWLDLHNTEYSLCEFNKYMRAHFDGGKRKNFIPTEDSLFEGEGMR